MSFQNFIEEASSARWDSARAQAWYEKQPWLLGCNFTPSSAINQLEMWQQETFNPEQIDLELGWLADIGMNSVRIFLHDLMWLNDAKGFTARLEQFLEIAHRYKIGTMIVFFDSVWHPFPAYGKQPIPQPNVHNSGWVQSPGLAVLQDEKEWARLEDYVSSIIQRYRADERVVLWDIWNEPDNPNTLSGSTREPQAKGDLILPLLHKSFGWARKADPLQPLTSGVWRMDQFDPETKKDALPQYQLAASDVISFHLYEPLAKVCALVEKLKEHHRPILCTEYLARSAGSTFQELLPYFKAEKIGAYNWGAVAGKTQTHFPWDSWQKTYLAEPPVWHHEIFRPNGSPYDPEEIRFIKALVSSKA